MQQQWIVTGILLSSLALGGCATVVEGDDQTVTVITDPSGAVCFLNRGTTTVGVADPTPASVLLKKSKEDLNVICRKEGYFDRTRNISPKSQTMTLGNFILGGMIGVGIDAASGAMFEYPDVITLVLSPTSFSSADTRDAFFDRQRKRIGREAEQATRKVWQSCHETRRDRCESLARAIDDARDAELRELEQQHEAAGIDSAE